jgi:hypothetical protein
MIEIEVQQKQRDAEFLAALKARAFAQALGETPSALAKSARSRVYRGNT